MDWSPSDPVPTCQSSAQSTPNGRDIFNAPEISTVTRLMIWTWGDSLPPKVYSGQPESEILLTILQPDGDQGYGYNLAAGGDMTGDGVPDMAVSETRPGMNGCVYLISGSDGELVATFSAADGEFNYMYRTDMQFADANNDGRTDLYLFGAYTTQVYNRAGDEMSYSDMQWRNQPPQD